MNLTFPNIHGNSEIYMDCLRAVSGDTEGKSMIDMGCNHAPHTPLLGFKIRTYIDILPRELDHKEEQRFFIQMDLFDLDTTKDKCDVTICSDCIEHVTKANGFKLLELMESLSDKQVLFTPLGDYMVDYVSTDPEGHHSGWNPEDVPGYASIVFPDYHPTLNVGAFFFWRCDNIKQDFERVKQILLSKTWTR